MHTFDYHARSKFKVDNCKANKQGTRVYMKIYANNRQSTKVQRNSCNQHKKKTLHLPRKDNTKIPATVMHTLSVCLSQVQHRLLADLLSYKEIMHAQLKRVFQGVLKSKHFRSCARRILRVCCLVVTKTKWKFFNLHPKPIHVLRLLRLLVLESVNDFLMIAGKKAQKMFKRVQYINTCRQIRTGSCKTE